MARTYGISPQAKRVRDAVRKHVGRVRGRLLGAHTSFTVRRDRSTGLRYKEYGEAHSEGFRHEGVDLAALAASVEGTVWVYGEWAHLSSQYAPGGRVLDIEALGREADQFFATHPELAEEQGS